MGAGRSTVAGYDTHVVSLQALASNQTSPILASWTGPVCGNNTFSTWSDVYCSGGRVAELRLSSLGLVGTLPAAWANLTALQRLYIRFACSHCPACDGNAPCPIHAMVTLLAVGQHWRAAACACKGLPVP